MPKFSLSILLIALSLILCIEPVKAQTTTAVTGQSEPILSGSGLKVEDIAMKCDAIFIGQIVSLGDAETASAGIDTRGASIKVLQILRGSVGSQVGVAISTSLWPSLHEQIPQVGKSYIFFVHQEGTRFTVLKLLPATDDHISKVKALIAAAPASK
ncbi:hypothetical protein OAG63_01840 [Methylacidiphilales bacterium]|nr:hypothetical protein [Candidatus Methylacidiphilales bacterium]